MSGIPYHLLVQRALRDVVIKEALAIAASEDGLPGDHHFFIRFRTNALGVQMPASLKEQYPHEMTIVLRNRFWDMKVESTCFSVTLTFGGVPSPLVIPYGAIVRFEDPSVEFGVELAPRAEPMHVVGSEDAEAPDDVEGSEDAEPSEGAVHRLTPVERETPAASAPTTPEDSEASSSEDDGEESSAAEVVSLDHFRRK